MVASSLLWAGLLHCVWIFFTNTFTQNNVEPGIFLGLLSSDKDLQSSSINKVAAKWKDVATYLISLYAFCVLFPRIVRAIVDKYRLDSIYSPFRRFFRLDDADYHYLFTGIDFPKKDQPDFVIISAVAEVGKESFIYKGALDDYFTDSSGELSRIVLSGASRRRLDNDRKDIENSSEKDERFYEINGDYFVLKYEDIKSLNVHYIKIE